MGGAHYVELPKWAGLIMLSYHKWDGLMFTAIVSVLCMLDYCAPSKLPMMTVNCSE